MDKMKFKDVAHLYLGCNVKENSGMRRTLFLKRITHNNPSELAEVGIKDVSFNMYFRGFKPILRKLESMTEEEGQEFFGRVMNFGKQFPHGFTVEHKEGYVRLAPKSKILDGQTITVIKPNANNLPAFNCTYYAGEVAWLLSKSFDLFGLIESGEALEEKEEKG